MTFQHLKSSPESPCKVCGNKKTLVTQSLGFCASCARKQIQETLPFILETHARVRQEFGLPSSPPQSSQGVQCPYCVNQCQINSGELGFCGLRTNKKGKLVHLGGISLQGIARWYYDPLPTNCVADWVCPGGSRAGYPDFSYSRGPEYGFKNLAVFLGACAFDCLFCQNWYYREMSRTLSPKIMAKELAGKVDKKTACICYFGGDPAVQLPFALAVSRLALQRNQGRILRICWETNGAMNPILARRVLELSFDSGGCVKFDLKAYNENLHFALTGVTNKRTFKNFEEMAKRVEERPDPPLLIASTLLIPGYVERKEVAQIAKFIADLNPSIPYSLLAFYPAFKMTDLPTTSWEQARECQEVALEAGLTKVKIGNVHLLR